MKVTTKAIVLHTHKYGDTSLIVKLYTEEAGLKSYLLRGVLSSKKGKARAAYFQPLTQLEIVANHKNTGGLSSISDVRIDFPYATIHTDFQKNSLVFFLSEVLYAVLQEEEENKPLFQYLSIMLQWLDMHNQVANFHIYFMLNLTKFLGFYPDEVDENAIFFDLYEGQFLNDNVSSELIEDEQLAVFKQLLVLDVSELHQLKMSKTNRLGLLHKMLTFYQLHLDGFRKPKSLQILSEIMM